ncbi:hypothetical protein K523DRAFT_269186 [Schizophyllum commune Tattone D]|nr:hypothetical protein K523DRAFT_269186 [Schizophyllum commune Tattone D]
MPFSVKHAFSRTSSQASVTAPGPAGRDTHPAVVAVGYLLGKAQEASSISCAPLQSDALFQRILAAFVACLNVSANKADVIEETEAFALLEDAIAVKDMFHQAEKDMFSVRLSIIPACKHAWLSGNAQTAIALADDIIARAVAIIRRVEASLGRLDAAINYARTGGVEGRTAIYAALSFICEVNKLGDKDFGLQRAYKLAQRANGFGATVFTARMREVCRHELTSSFAVAMPTGEVVAVDAYAQAAFTYDAKREGHAFKALSQQVAAGPAPTQILPRASPVDMRSCDSPATEHSSPSSQWSQQSAGMWTAADSARSSITSIASEASIYSQDSAVRRLSVKFTPRRAVPSALFEALGDVLDPVEDETTARSTRRSPLPCQGPASVPAFEVKLGPRVAGRPRPIGMLGGATGGSLRPVVPPPARLVSRAVGQGKANAKPALAKVTPASQWGAPVGFTLPSKKKHGMMLASTPTRSSSSFEFLVRIAYATASLLSHEYCDVWLALPSSATRSATHSVPLG